MVRKPVVQIGPIPRTTPTLWSYMRLCALRAALSASREAEEWVLHDPRAWLGIAFHHLMSARPRDTAEATRLWDAAVGQLMSVLLSHRLDVRYAKPERWPGYYLLRQRAIASAIQSAGDRSSPQQLARAKPPSHGSEKLLTARNGRLAGRPDHFGRRVVTEYKSMLPDPSWQAAESILDGYWRQLKLYAVLLGEMGQWPATARIVSASGQSLERDINRNDCENEADAAVAALEAMNNSLVRDGEVSAIATPEEISCGQCQYQAICPAFWSWHASAGWPKLRDSAARGRLESVALGLDGDLYTIALHLEGSRGWSREQNLVLRRSIHGDLTGCAAGTWVKVVSASEWPDGRLKADISTCVFSEGDLPELVIQRRA